MLDFRTTRNAASFSSLPFGSMVRRDAASTAAAPRSAAVGRRHFLGCLGGAAAALVCGPARAIEGRWVGRIAGDGGLWMDAAYRFGARGHPILDMAARSGIRSFELTTVGQHEKWLLPGSGYATMTVRSLNVTPQIVQVVNAITKDQTLAEGVLFHEEGWFALEFTLQGSQLACTRIWQTVRTTTSSWSGVQQENLVENLQGVLRRASRRRAPCPNPSSSATATTTPRAWRTL